MDRAPYLGNAGNWLSTFLSRRRATEIDVAQASIMTRSLPNHPGRVAAASVFAAVRAVRQPKFGSGTLLGAETSLKPGRSDPFGDASRVGLRRCVQR
jgi:hypothetical protein